MSIFRKNKKTEKQNPDYAKLISALNGCKYEKVPENYTPRQITDLYIREYESGKKSGYIPIIVAAGANLHEMIEFNYEDNGDGNAYRNTLLNMELPDGQEYLNGRFEEYVSDYDEEYDIYGKYSEKFCPCMNFLSIGKKDLDKDESLVIFKVPIKEPWKIFAWFPFGGWNECPDVEDIMAVCKYWYEKYDAVPAVIQGDILEMYTPSPISDIDTAFLLAKEQYGFCNDIVDQGTGTIKLLAETLVNSPVWFFWWD